MNKKSWQLGKMKLDVAWEGVVSAGEFISMMFYCLGAAIVVGLVLMSPLVFVGIVMAVPIAAMLLIFKGLGIF